LKERMELMRRIKEHLDVNPPLHRVFDKQIKKCVNVIRVIDGLERHG
jgi:hypothetical protein